MTLNEIRRNIVYGNILDAERKKRDGMSEDTELEGKARKKPRYKIITLHSFKSWDSVELDEDGYRVHSTQPDYILMELETVEVDEWHPIKVDGRVVNTGTVVGDSSLPPWISSEGVDSTGTYAIIDGELSTFDGKKWVEEGFHAGA